MSVFLVTENEKSSIKGVPSLNCEDENFFKACIEFWNNQMNKEDRPVTPNKNGQYPMLRIYEDGEISAEKYISMSDFCGVEVVGKISLTKKDGIIFGMMNAKDLIETLKTNGLQLKLIDDNEEADEDEDEANEDEDEEEVIEDEAKAE
jgi:hypothetical protein